MTVRLFPGRRNPPPPPAAPPWPKGRAKTPGRLLFELAVSRPPTGDPAAITRDLKLIEQAARLLKAEADAGLWRDD